MVGPQHTPDHGNARGNRKGHRLAPVAFFVSYDA